MTHPPRRWLAPVLGLATFLIVLVGFGGLVGDAVARNAEMNALVTAIEQSEAAMSETQENVRGVIAAYEGSGQLDDVDRAEIDAALKAAAEQGREAIAAAAGPVGDVRWLVWHRDVKAAQEAYLAHNRAWQEYLDRASTDPTEFARPQDLINSSFADAENEVRAAIPLIAGYDLRDRIDVIFAPPPVEEGDGQQA
jgi:hypothetical protein